MARPPTYHNVFREEIVAERAINKVNLVEHLHLCIDHLTLIVAAILVFGNYSVSKRY